MRVSLKSFGRSGIFDSPEDERAAFAYFKRHQDQAYSFVDCLSFVVMEKLRISEAFARAAHRQSLAVAGSPRAKEDQEFVSAISAWNAE